MPRITHAPTRGVLGVFVLAASQIAMAQDQSDGKPAPSPVTLPGITVNASPTFPERNLLPGTTAGITSEEFQREINVVNTEDALKYLPSIVIRKRHIGDVQAPIQTRTSGLGQSARSLIYADGVLLSALIGNNNTIASPRWGLVTPQEIDRIDVMYGPFAAAYPGNSMGVVVEITTHMPQQPETSAQVLTSTQTLQAIRHARQLCRVSSRGNRRRSGR